MGGSQDHLIFSCHFHLLTNLNEIFLSESDRIHRIIRLPQKSLETCKTELHELSQKLSPSTQITFELSGVLGERDFVAPPHREYGKGITLFP